MANPDALLSRWSTRRFLEDHAWSSIAPGPALATVMTRLSSVPSSFMAPDVDVAALAADLRVSDLACLSLVDQEEVRQGAAIGLWLAGSQITVEPFSPPVGRAQASLVVDILALRLAAVSAPVTWIADERRREEAARIALLAAGFAPAGESPEHARAVFAGLDSLAQHQQLLRVMKEQEHREAIAAKLADAQAKEAAARYNRE